MPAIVPGATMLGFLLGFGVKPQTAIVYLGYETAYLIAPGWLAYRAIASRPGSALRQLAVGWALGYVLEIGFFMATAASGTRGLFAAYPLLVAALALPVVLRSRGAAPRPADDQPPASRTWVWALAGIAALAVIWSGTAYFASTPFPGRAAVYFPDYLYHLSLAAEAKHHWPITDPGAAGEPKAYHYFVHIHLAAASTITGIDLPVVFFRLYLLPLILLFVVQIAAVGRALTRNAWAALVAVVLTIFTGEMDFDDLRSVISGIPFNGFSFDALFLSPSLLLAAVFLLPLVLVLADLLDGGGERRERTGLWALAALFALACSNAKVFALPVILVALGLVVGWDAILNRRLNSRALAAAALLAAVVAGVYVVQYTGQSGEVEVQPLVAVGKSMPAVSLVEQDLLGNLEGLPLRSALVQAGGAIFGLLALLGAMVAGLYWLLRVQRLRLSRMQGWLAAVSISGLFLTELLVQPGGTAGYYFLDLSYPFAAMLTAQGLCLAWDRYGADLREQWLRLVPAVAAWLAALVLLIAAPGVLDLFATDSRRIAHTYLFWFGGLALLLVALYLAAWLLSRRGSKAPALLLSAGVLVAATVGTPLDYVPGLIRGGLNPPPTVAKGITPARHEGLTWIRDHTDTDSVLAVNNHWSDLANLLPANSYYSAFAERRVFLEGWFYSDKALKDSVTPVAQGAANPFADRLALGDAAFRGDCAALRGIAARGVDYLVVDRVDGTVIPATGVLDRYAETVYENPEITVLALRQGPIARCQ